jgi:predicted nicotinamide N-methyase
MDLVVYTPPVVAIVAQHSIHIGGAIGRTLLVGQQGKGTGRMLWPAAELLSEYLAKPAAGEVLSAAAGVEWAWKGKAVLELGAGLGLLATTLLLLGAAVVATDGEISVVEQMNRNLDMNREGVLEAAGAFRYSGVVFDWGTDISLLTDNLTEIYNTFSNSTDRDTCTDTSTHSICTHHQKSAYFNVIIASDVVYGSDVTVWDKLLQSIVELTKLTNEKVLVLIAQTERYKSSEDLFYARASQALRLVGEVDLSGVASSCVHPGMRSKTKLYIFTSEAPVTEAAPKNEAESS